MERMQTSLPPIHPGRWQFRLVMLAMVWGSSFLFIKVALTDLTPTQIAFARCGLGTLAVVPAIIVARSPFPRTPRLWAHLFVAALVLNTAPFLLFSYAELHISSAVAGVANGAAPLFTVLFALLALRDERPTLRTAAGLVVGLLGVSVVLRVWDGIQADTAGITMAVAAAACYGLGWVYIRRFVHDSGCSPLVLTTCQLALATVQLLAVCIATSPSFPAMAPDTLAATLALGGLGTGAAYVLQHSIIRDAGATAASTVTYLIPVFAVLAGAAFLHEPLAWNLVAGAVLVILGAGLIRHRQPTRPANTVPVRV